MAKKQKRSTPMAEQIEREQEEQMMKINPIAAAERLREQLLMDAEHHLVTAQGAVGNAIDNALAKAMEVWRMYVGFSHALAEASGKRIYEVRKTLFERAGSDFLKQRLLVLRATAPKSVEMPGGAIINAIRAQRQPAPGPVFKNLDEATPDEINELRDPAPTQYELERAAMRRRGPSVD
jgi:hypothetical protein